MKASSEIDSKFRFVILASKRAKELLRGVKPRIKTKSKNLIRIAQNEVRNGLIEYEIVEPKMEEIRKPEDEGFIGEEIGNESEETGEEDKDKIKGKDKKSKEKLKEKVKAKPGEKTKGKKKKS